MATHSVRRRAGDKEERSSPVANGQAHTGEQYSDRHLK